MIKKIIAYFLVITISLQSMSLQTIKSNHNNLPKTTVALNTIFLGNVNNDKIQIEKQIKELANGNKAHMDSFVVLLIEIEKLYERIFPDIVNIVREVRKDNIHTILYNEKIKKLVEKIIARFNVQEEEKDYFINIYSDNITRLLCTAKVISSNFLNTKFVVTFNDLIEFFNIFDDLEKNFQTCHPDILLILINIDYQFPAKTYKDLISRFGILNSFVINSNADEIEQILSESYFNKLSEQNNIDIDSHLKFYSQVVNKAGASGVNVLKVVTKSIIENNVEFTLGVQKMLLKYIDKCKDFKLDGFIASEIFDDNDLLNSFPFNGEFIKHNEELLNLFKNLEIVNIPIIKSTLLGLREIISEQNIKDIFKAMVNCVEHIKDKQLIDWKELHIIKNSEYFFKKGFELFKEIITIRNFEQIYKLLIDLFINDSLSMDNIKYLFEEGLKEIILIMGQDILKLYELQKQLFLDFSKKKISKDCFITYCRVIKNIGVENEEEIIGLFDFMKVFFDAYKESSVRERIILDVNAMKAKYPKNYINLLSTALNIVIRYKKNWEEFTQLMNNERDLSLNKLLSFVKICKKRALQNKVFFSDLVVKYATVSSTTLDKLKETDVNGIKLKDIKLFDIQFEYDLDYKIYEQLKIELGMKKTFLEEYVGSKSDSVNISRMMNQTILSIWSESTDLPYNYTVCLKYVFGLLYELHYSPIHKENRLYRGLDIDNKYKQIYGAKIGESKIIDLNTFSSTSMDHKESFNKNCKFIYCGCEGISVVNSLPNHEFKFEKEVLIGPGKFEIKYLGENSKYTYTENGQEKTVNFDKKCDIYELRPIKLKVIEDVNRLEISDIEFQYQDPIQQKQIIRVGDIHGKIEQIITPIVKNGIGTYTGELIGFDTEKLEEVDLVLTKVNPRRYIALTEIILNNSPPRKQIIYMGDVIDNATNEENKRAFYLLAYLLKQQQKKGLKVISYIMGNHELRTFYKSIGNDDWHLNGDESLREEIFYSLKKLAQEDLIIVWEVRNNTLHSHAPLGIEFLIELKNELNDNKSLIAKLKYGDKTVKEIQEAMNYFIEKSLDKSNFDKIGEYENPLLKEEKVTRYKLKRNDQDNYAKNLKILEEHMNRIFKICILEAEFSHKDNKWEKLQNSSVLFKDMEEGSNFRPAITTFWARPNKDGHYVENRVNLARAVQQVYGHHAIKNEFCRLDVFYKDVNTPEQYVGVVCCDGEAYNAGVGYMEDEGFGEYTGRVVRIRQYSEMSVGNLKEESCIDSIKNDLKIMYESFDKTLSEVDKLKLVLHAIIKVIKKEIYENTNNLLSKNNNILDEILKMVLRKKYIKGIINNPYSVEQIKNIMSSV
jgi:hypothetical protein